MQILEYKFTGSFFSSQELKCLIEIGFRMAFYKHVV